MTDETRAVGVGAARAEGAGGGAGAPLHEKELDLLRDEARQMSSSVSRFALLRLSIMAVLVFSLANSFRQIETETINAKRKDIGTLGKITGRPAQSLADPFRDFFIVGNILSGGTKRAGRAKACTCKSVWAAVEAAMLKDGSASEVLAAHKPGDTAACPDEQAAEESPCAGPAEEEFRDAPPPPPSVRPGAGAVEGGFVAFSPEVRNAANDLQAKLAGQIAKTYDDAFRMPLSFLGASVSLDLRNWLAFLPFFYIVSAAYAYIQRRKLRLIQALAAHRVRALRELGKPVASSDLLLFSDDPAGAAAYARHPAQLMDWTYASLVVGLLVYFVYSSGPFLATVRYENSNYGDSLTLLLRVIIPAALTLLTACLYAFVYCLRVRAKLWAEFEKGTGVSPAGSGFDEFARAAWARVATLFARTAARPWLKTGGALLLLTLLLAVTTDSCGAPRPGYMLVLGRVPADEESAEADAAWWPPAMWGSVNITGTDQEKNAVTQALLTADQTAGRAAYTASLLLAASTLALTWYYRGERRGRFPPRLARLLLAACALITLYVVLDFYLYFLKPRLKYSLVGVYLLLPAALALYLRLRHGPPEGRRRERLLRHLADVYWPVVVLSLASLAVVAAYFHVQFIGLRLGEDVSDYGLAGGLIIHAVALEGLGPGELAEANLGLGILCLIAGSLCMCAGYAKLCGGLIRAAAAAGEEAGGAHDPPADESGGGRP